MEHKHDEDKHKLVHFSISGMALPPYKSFFLNNRCYKNNVRQELAKAVYCLIEPRDNAYLWLCSLYSIWY